MQAKTEEGQRIESLQLEIEKVEGDICRKSHYTRQLEHMLLRLRSNQVTQTPILYINDPNSVSVKEMQIGLTDIIYRDDLLCIESHYSIRISEKGCSVSPIDVNSIDVNWRICCCPSYASSWQYSQLLPASIPLALVEV
jgi:hypothetical protein